MSGADLAVSVVGAGGGGCLSQGLPVGTEGNKEGLRRRSRLRFAASALRIFSNRML